MRPDAVAVATLTARDVPLEFLKSWGDMLQHDASRGRHLSDGGGRILMSSGPRIAEARSQIVDMFFQDPQIAEASWLLMIDSDMTFERNLVEELLRFADAKERPIVGGLCFAGGRDHDPYPTIYKETLTTGEDGKEFPAIEPIRDYPPDTLCKVGATGAACLMVHRQVFVAMSHPYPEGFGTQPDGRKNPYPWFAENHVAPNGEPMGEDIVFCRRAAQLGIPIHVHTGIKLGHVKHFILDENWFLAGRDARTAAVAQTDAEVAEVTAAAQAKRKPAAERRAAARKALASAGQEPDVDDEAILAGALGR